MSPLDPLKQLGPMTARDRLVFEAAVKATCVRFGTWRSGEQFIGARARPVREVTEEVRGAKIEGRTAVDVIATWATGADL